MSEGVRWSLARDCPRKAVLAATHTPDRQFDDWQDRALMRGRRAGRDYADMLAQEHGEENIVREKPVRWPCGTLHTDVFLKPRRLPIEVLTSVKPSAATIRSKLLQLAGEVYYDDEADDRGVLVIFNPVDYSEERQPLVVNDHWRDLVEATTASVQAGLNGGGLPDRVCRKPSEATGHFCRYAATCFQGWTPPEWPRLANDPRLRELVERWRAAKKREREHRAETSTAEEERKQVQAELAALVEPGTYTLGPYEITRSQRTRKTLSAAKAEAAGLDVADLVKTSRYDVWTVDLTDDWFEDEVDTDDDEAPF